MHSQNTKKTEKSLRYGNIVFASAILVCLILPVLIVNIHIGEWFNFQNKGQIGDVIGGITAPIIGLASAYLIFISFKAQIDANRLQREMWEISRNDILEQEKVKILWDNIESVTRRFVELEIFTISKRLDNVVSRPKRQFIVANDFHIAAKELNMLVNLLTDIRNDLPNNKYISTLNEKIKNLVHSYIISFDFFQIKIQEETVALRILGDVYIEIKRLNKLSEEIISNLNLE